MSFSVFCLFLILLQNRLTEQTTDETTESTTDNTSSSSGFSENTPSEEPTTGSTMYESTTNSWNTQINLSTNLISEGTTEDSDSYSRNIRTFSSREPITELTTEGSNTLSTVTTKFKPIIQSRVLPNDVSTKPEKKIFNQQETKFYEKNFSTASVLGIVLGSIVCTVAVFYITVSLITKFRRKSYIVRSPSMELGQA